MIIKFLMIQIISVQVLNQVHCILVSAPNYFKVICDFLKAADICEYGYESRYLKINFIFGMSLELDCGYKNETINDVYFQNDGDNIFLYSVINNLSLIQNQLSDSSNMISYFIFLPLSELISLFNNKNVPLIFIYLPVSSSSLKLRVRFDEFIQQDYKPNQTRKLISDEFSLSKNCSRLNVTDFNSRGNEFSAYNESRNKSLLIKDGRQMHREHSEIVQSKDNKFYTYLSIPSKLKKQLKDDNFIYNQNKMDKNLFLKLILTFEHSERNANFDLYSGSIVLNYCSIIRDNNFVTYDCEVIDNYGKLECSCKNLTPPVYFNFNRYVIILALIFAGIYTKRVSKIFLAYINKLIIFKKTKSDRVLYILCSKKSAMFDYVLTFELGNRTPSLDLNTTCIDFELQAPDKTVITQGRILGRILFDEKINHIEFVIRRLTPLNRDMIDSITIQHNNTNQNAKIFLYDITLKQLKERKKFILSVNDYVRQYKQKYNLILATSSGSIGSKVDDSVNSLSKNTSYYPNQPSIKSCEVVPSKRIIIENYPPLNDLEIELLLAFSIVCSFFINVWLVKHQLCNERTFFCYFNYFKISVTLTILIYLITHLIFKFLFKHQQMKAIYLKETGLWNVALFFLKILLVLASFFLCFFIYTFQIKLSAFNFYACTFSLMYTGLLFIFFVDLFNIFEKKSAFIRALNFKSNFKTKSERNANESFYSESPFQSAEFKISNDQAKMLKPNGLDNYYSDLKSPSKPKKSESGTSTKSISSSSNCIDGFNSFPFIREQKNRSAKIEASKQNQNLKSKL